MNLFYLAHFIFSGSFLHSQYKLWVYKSNCFKFVQSLLCKSSLK